MFHVPCGGSDENQFKYLKSPNEHLVQQRINSPYAWRPMSSSKGGGHPLKRGEYPLKQDGVTPLTEAGEPLKFKRSPPPTLGGGGLPLSRLTELAKSVGTVNLKSSLSAFNCALKLLSSQRILEAT